MNIVDVARQVLEQRQYRTFEGVVVDMQTANAIVTVFDSISIENKAKLLRLPVTQAAAVCWQLLTV